MPIVGFNLTKIEANKFKSIDALKKGEQIKIESKFGINEIKEEKLPTGKTKTDGLKFNFAYSLKYEPGIADISLNGFIYFLDDPKILKEITDKWKKEKKMPVDVQSQILNTVILKSSIKALQLEQEINLPPHMPFPSLRPASKSSSEEYIG